MTGSGNITGQSFSYVVQYQADDGVYLVLRTVDFPYCMSPTLVNLLSRRVFATALLLHVTAIISTIQSRKSLAEAHCDTYGVDLPQCSVRHVLEASIAYP